MAVVNKTMKTFNVPAGNDTICYEIVDASARSGKLDIYQGAGNAGKYMNVGNDGNLTPVTLDLSGKIDTSQKGSANGVAELDANGKVPSAQLPSYVDDVLEYASLSNFPATGETGKIYIALDTNKTYRWSGSAYVEISASLALGETDSTAYRGDRGKTAYDHASAKGSAFASGLYKVTTNSEGHVTDATAVTKADITALGIPGQDTTYSDMTGAGASEAGAHGLVPAPASGDNTKYLRGDGTWATISVPPDMVVLSYGHSTWSDFITAYNTNSVVYCRASSGSNPGSGSQTRMAFMAYVNNSDNPTEVEFQYYRSVSSHSASQQGDQVFVYKLTSASGGTWTVTTREAMSKIAAGTNMSSSYSNGTITLNATDTTYSDFTGASSSAAGAHGLVPAPATGDDAAFLRGDATWANLPLMDGATSSVSGTSGLVPAPSSGDQDKVLKGDGTWGTVDALPAVTSSDNGKFLRVVDGAWAAASIASANGVSF